MNTRETILCSEKCEILNWFPKFYASGADTLCIYCEEASVIGISERVRVLSYVLYV